MLPARASAGSLKRIARRSNAARHHVTTCNRYCTCNPNVDIRVQVILTASAAMVVSACTCKSRHGADVT